MAASCLKHGKYAPAPYNTLVNAGLDLRFIGAGDGRSHFKNRNVFRMTMFRTSKRDKAWWVSVTQSCEW